MSEWPNKLWLVQGTGMIGPKIQEPTYLVPRELADALYDALVHETDAGTASISSKTAMSSRAALARYHAEVRSNA